jgi:hypothetical protein
MTTLQQGRSRVALAGKRLLLVLHGTRPQLNVVGRLLLAL